MIMKIKSLLTYIFLIILNCIANFIIYNYSFNIQATPYLHEEQRVESGLLMLKTTLPAFVVSALLFAFLFYIVAKYFITRVSK